MHTSPRLPTPHGPYAPPHQHGSCAPLLPLRTSNSTDEPTVPLPQAEMSPRCDASKEDTHRTSNDEQGFHPKLSVLQSLVPYNGAPSEEKRRPKGAATITTDIVSEGFRPELAPSQLHAPSHGRSTLPNAPATPLPEEARHSPKPHLGATASPTTKAAPTQHCRRGREGEHQPPHLRYCPLHATRPRLHHLQAATTQNGQSWWRPATATAGRGHSQPWPLTSHSTAAPTTACPGQPATTSAASSRPPCAPAPAAVAAYPRRQQPPPGPSAPAVAAAAALSADHHPAHAPMHAPVAQPPDPDGAAPDPGAQASTAACAARDEHLLGDRTVAAAEIHRRGGEEPRRHHPHRPREMPAAHSGGGAAGSGGEGRRWLGFGSPASPRALRVFSPADPANVHLGFVRRHDVCMLLLPAGVLGIAAAARAAPEPTALALASSSGSKELRFPANCTPADLLPCWPSAPFTVSAAQARRGWDRYADVVHALDLPQRQRKCNGAAGR
jgi:hypothetical protein